jgi:hypothetical protein
MLQSIDYGLDDISLCGSFITMNDNFIFVSSNGNNIYNGLVTVYYKNVTKENDVIKITKHSIIYSPEYLNTNFGIKISATNRYLAVSGLNYDVYTGIIYVYEFIKERWINIRKIYSIKDNYLNGFGNNLFFLNDNLLFVSDFYNNIYEFRYNTHKRKFYITNTIKFMETNQIKYNLNMVSDKINNLFITNNTNILTTYNIDKNIVSYYKENTPYNCFYGSNIYFYKSTLFISCSLNYPFYNIPDNIISKIFIYNIGYNDYVVSNIMLVQIINAINNDPYFGTSISIYDNNMIICGKNNAHQYTKKTQWKLKNTFIVPDSDVNYDYKVQLTKDYFILGNYGFNELQGAIFSGFIENEQSKSIIIQDKSQITNNNIQTHKIRLFLMITILGLLLSFTFILCTYFCVIFFNPHINEKKKKKEEEEYSPYKVYSYTGYVETDDIIVDQNNLYNYYPPYNFANNNLYVSPYNHNYPYYYRTQQLSPMEKGSSEKPKVEYSKETTVSYKGYTYDMIQKNYKEKIKPILDEIKK